MVENVTSNEKGDEVWSRIESPGEEWLFQQTSPVEGTVVEIPLLKKGLIYISVGWPCDF